MMTTQTKLVIYCLAILLGGLFCMWYEHDKSAMAAWGFALFFFPIFFIKPAMIVAVVAAAVELVLLILRLD